MGRVEGKVAFITGAARGQGRSHAVRLAEEGADIIALDLFEKIEATPYDPPSAADLEQTARQVEALDRRIVSREADVRDCEAVEAVLDEGIAELGRIDIVCANAGIGGDGVAWELSEQAWRDMIDINLGGVWHTAKAAIPRLLRQGEGGSIVLTGSTGAFRAYPNLSHYVAAKHGVVGLAKNLAAELAAERIRVNSVNPTSVNTPMIRNEPTYDLFLPDVENPTEAQIEERFATLHAMPAPWIEPVDVSNAVLFLASDEARYVTGTALVVDAGLLLK